MSDGLRIPPNSLDAEQAVLGGLMLIGRAWWEICDVVEEGDFYRRNHQLIFRAIRQLAEQNRPFDAVTLGDWFESHGQAELVEGGAYLIELASTTPSAANIRAYAEIVADKARLRRLIEIATETANAAVDPQGRMSVELLNEATRRLSEVQPAQAGWLRRVADGLSPWFERFTSLYERGDRMTGLPTQWEGVNDVTHGLQPATLYLIAARPSMGKSVWGLNLATFLAMRGNSVGFFS